jgi:hypothetical protein
VLGCGCGVELVVCVSVMRFFGCVCGSVGAVLGVFLQVFWVMAAPAGCVHACSKWQTLAVPPDFMGNLKEGVKIPPSFRTSPPHPHFGGSGSCNAAICWAMAIRNASSLWSKAPTSVLSTSICPIIAPVSGWRISTTISERVSRLQAR